MARLRSIAVWAVAAIAVLAALGVTFTIGWRPFLGPRVRPATDQSFARTPERLERGRYLVEFVTGCMDCHSAHDWKLRDAPLIAETRGAGQIFPAVGLPGRLVASNLTSDAETGLGDWKDDEIARAIREGVSRDGHALFPVMPYGHFRHLSDEDVMSIVVYLRTFPAIRRQLPVTEIAFPLRYLMRSFPGPLTAPVAAPDLSTPAKRGDYLVEIAGCQDCHTPQKNGQPIAGMEFAGGFIQEGPWGRVAGANITPDPSGIRYYDAELFRQMMKTGFVKARPINAVMPWPLLRYMQDQDINDMFAYLQTLKPVSHRVDNAEPPTLCRLCGQSHGYGDKN